MTELLFLHQNGRQGIDGAEPPVKRLRLDKLAASDLSTEKSVFSPYEEHPLKHKIPSASSGDACAVVPDTGDEIDHDDIDADDIDGDVAGDVAGDVLHDGHGVSFRHAVLQQRRCGTDPRTVMKWMGIRPPQDVEAAPNDVLWHSILESGHPASYRRWRARLSQLENGTLDDVVRLMQRSRRILVLTGAGISVASGIPDFRSHNGVYERLRERYDLPSPESMFDIRYFRNNPRPFFTFAKELFPGQYRPSLAHRFIKLLEDRGSLLRNYTQNIDTLEQACGITRVVQCHGSFATASCIECRASVPGEALRAAIFSETIPHCEHCDGVMKPDIVFFHESLPDVFARALRSDRDRVDLVIVMGSSLQVHPVASIIGYLPRNVPQILINREVVGFPHAFDFELLGDCDAIIAYLCARLGWEIPDVSTLFPPACAVGSDNTSHQTAGASVAATARAVGPSCAAAEATAADSGPSPAATTPRAVAADGSTLCTPRFQSLALDAATLVANGTSSSSNGGDVGAMGSAATRDGVTQREAQVIEPRWAGHTRWLFEGAQPPALPPEVDEAGDDTATSSETSSSAPARTTSAAEIPELDTECCFGFDVLLRGLLSSGSGNNVSDAAFPTVPLPLSPCGAQQQLASLASGGGVGGDAAARLARWVVDDFPSGELVLSPVMAPSADTALSSLASWRHSERAPQPSSLLDQDDDEWLNGMMRRHTAVERVPSVCVDPRTLDGCAAPGRTMDGRCDWAPEDGSGRAGDALLLSGDDLMPSR